MALTLPALPRSPVRLSRVLDGLALRRGWRILSRLARFLAHAALFLVIALGTGLGSAWYAVDTGTPLTVDSSGPWRSWRDLGRVDADPYTRAHAVRSGGLALGATLTRVYEARRDSDGSMLYGDCEYDISGTGPEAAWWSIAAYDLSGRLLPNLAERHSVTSSTVLREPSGRFTIRLAETARPGNWLPVSGQEAIVLVMHAMLPATTGSSDLPTIGGNGGGEDLPEIRRLQCR